MKSILPPTLRFATVLALGACLAGCNQRSEAPVPVASQPGSKPSEPSKAPSPGSGLRSAEPTSFHEVAAHLDPGGSAYVYFSTEQWLSGASEKIAGWRGLFDAIPDMKSDDRANLGRVFDVVTHLIKQSGVEEVSGFGMSGIAVEKGVYRTKTLLHHYKGKNSGYLWTALGRAPHPLSNLDLLPANTALAIFVEADLPQVWKAIQEAVAALNVPEVTEKLRMFPSQFELGTGLNFDKLLQSFGGEFGIILTLNPTSTVSIPLPDGSQLEIPEPGLMLVVRAKDDLLFKRLDGLLAAVPQVQSTDVKDLKMRIMTPPMPLPFAVRPTLALQEGNYLMLASVETLVQEALEAKAGKAKGLVSTDEFKRIAEGMPNQGNSFAWVSPRLGKVLGGLQQQFLKQAAQQNQGDRAGIEIVQKLLGGATEGFSYSVSANTDEGWLSISKSTQHPSQMALAPAVAVSAVAAGMVLPALAKAKNKAQNVSCANNLKMIDLAKRMWADDGQKADGSEVSQDKLLPYLGNGFPNCPAGGSYAINPIGAKPACSTPGHSLR
jgi:hypothetical protein